MEYSLEPGLYAVGTPGGESDVFVSANYRMSFNCLREALDGMNAWILVLDTAGINVWCAAGKGTFGTEELVRRIISARLEKIVSHRRIIVPQLGAPGISAAAVKKWTGFSVLFGPVEACNIGQYVQNGYHADARMRLVRFGMIERLMLTPIELNTVVKKLPRYLLIIGILFGLMPQGVIFSEAVKDGLPAALGLVLAVLAGAFLTPVLLPFIPFRSFAIKGWIAGFAVITAAGWFSGTLAGSSIWLAASAMVFFPVVSSFLALQFTGATTFTSMSGVEREVKRSLPVYRAAFVVTAALFAVYKLQIWGII
jgi:hypothetical protein